MKKLFIFFALLAGIAVITGCQKDQDVVTLKAVIDQETKAFFGDDHDHLPYWDGADKVYIAGHIPGQNMAPDSFLLDNRSTTFARITGVPACSVYCAIFPAKAVHTMGTPNAAETKATIKFPSEQMYILDGDHQRLEMPMGAVATRTSTGTTTLYFKNLCSILRVNVKNLLPNNTALEVRRITLNAYGAYITGKADVKLSENGVPTVAMDELDHEHNNVLSFYAPEYASMAHLNNNADKSFDIVVPPFDATYLILEVEVYNPSNGSILGYSSHVIGNPNATQATVHLVRNKIIPINLQIKNTNLLQPNYAYLEQGPTFNTDIHALITHATYPVTNISFNTTYQPSDLPAENLEEADLANLANQNHEYWTLVQDDISPYKIYAHLVDVFNTETQQNETHVHIVSRAPLIYANSICRDMFKNLTTLKSIHWNTSTEHGFQTEDVTDMSYMFAGCTNLTVFSGLENCITTNVRTMAHMFEGCSVILNGDNFNISNFNTHNLEDMEAMFKGCSAIRNLDLSSFTTNRVTNMKDLFSGCTLLFTNLYLDNNFVISDGTNITNMCENLNENTWGNILPIYCSENVETKLRSSATGLNTNKVTFHRPPHPTSK